MMILWSCLHPITCHHASPSCSKTNHDREKQLEDELESMTKCMFNVTRGEYLHKDILFLIMSIGCTRHSTGSSKHQGLGMNAFVTSFSTRTSRSGGWIQLYSQESSMKSYSYVKSMLMIALLVQLTPLFAKILEK